MKWSWGWGCLLLVVLSVSARAQEGFICEDITKATNGLRLVVYDPPSNRVDVYSCSDLMGRIWSISARDLPTVGSNILSWTDSSTASGLPVRIYALSDPTIDSDGDSYANSRERYIYLTDEYNSNSRPMRVSGLVSYNGCEQTGSIYVLTVMEESSWSVAKSVVLASPSAYTNDEIGNFASYWFKSFLDVNANCLRENWEPHGIYSAYSLYVTTDVSGVNIALNDQPSLWGVVNYSGSVTGNVYVLAVTASNSWQSLYQSVTVWQQGEDLTGGTTFASFPINFSMTELPATSLYVRAFIDANYDGEYSPPEPAGQFSASAIPVSNRVVLGAFTLGEDSDADQMPDWWELMHGFDPGNPADALLDRDSDEAANWKEYLFSINPDNSDSDADGMPDGWEIRYGLTPSVNDASGDMDGDGLSNLDEYKRGANPSNPDSDNDRISDGTNAVGLIYAGADPNPLTPAPGYLPCVETPSYRYLIRMEEDAVGRPIVAWYGMDALGQRHIYVAKWFGQPPEIVGQWAELDGMWEGFGSSLTLNGLVAPSNGTTGFDMALGTDDNPFVIWNDSKGYNARIKSGSDLDKLLF